MDNVPSHELLGVGLTCLFSKFGYHKHAASVAMLFLKSHKPYLGPIDKVPSPEPLGLGLAFFKLATINTQPVWKCSH